MHVILSTAEEEKKRKYCDAAEVRRASFTPLVVSVDGVLGREAECFVKLLAEKNCYQMEKITSRSSGMDNMLSFAILRATNLCQVVQPWMMWLVCQNLYIKWLRYVLLFYFFTFSIHVIFCTTLCGLLTCLYV